MAQSVTTRRAIITAFNQRGQLREVYVTKLVDEFRVNSLNLGNPGSNLPDDDLIVPVIPGLYLVEIIIIQRVPGSVSGTNGTQWNWTGPLGITDGFLGAFVQLGATFQKNAPLTGLATPQQQPVAAANINLNVSAQNVSGYVHFREPGDLQFNWNSIIAFGAGTNLLKGSSIHLVRALNDGD